MNALITIGACLIIAATAQYLDRFADPNCPSKNGRLMHDPRNHLGGSVFDTHLGSRFDTPAIGHRSSVDISVGHRINPIPGRWKRSAYRAPSSSYRRNRDFIGNDRFNRFDGVDRFDRFDRFDRRGGRGRFDRNDFSGQGRRWGGSRGGSRRGGY